MSTPHRFLAIMAGLLLHSAAVQALPAASGFTPVATSDRQLTLRADPHDAGTRVLPGAPIAYKILPKTATFNVTYVGFTPAAQAAFQHAVDVWEQLINSPVPIRVLANWTSLQPGVLGSARVNAYWTDGTHIYPDSLADALSGVDLGEGDFDIIANFNSDFDWYLDTDANTPAGRYDLATVVMHELAHGLGFAGLMDVNGFGYWLLAAPSIYAAFTEDLAGTSVVDTIAYPNFSVQLGDVLTSGSVFFGGPMAVAAAGGARPELYAPDAWSLGSSFSHLDEAEYPPGDDDSLMTPFLSAAEAIHHPGEIPLCMLRDMGWVTAGSCALGDGNDDDSLSSLADLIVPGFEVDVADADGPTTFFAVRNASDAAVGVDVAYHGAMVTDTPLRVDTLELGPHQTVTTNIAFDLTDLSVTDGFATGLILISETADVPTGSLGGDFFQLDQANAFATGDRLVRPEEDFCNLQEIRFVDFGSGSRFKILVDSPRGAAAPSFTYTAYDEPGNVLAQSEFFTSNHLTVIDVADLGIADPFGTVMFDFSGSGGGWVSAQYSAFGLFSVELNSDCRD